MGLFNQDDTEKEMSGGAMFGYALIGFVVVVVVIFIIFALLIIPAYLAYSQ